MKICPPLLRGKGAIHISCKMPEKEGDSGKNDNSPMTNLEEEEWNFLCGIQNTSVMIMPEILNKESLCAKINDCVGFGLLTARMGKIETR